MKNNQALKGSPSKKILYFYEMDGGYKVGEYIASYDVISQFRGRMVGGRRKGGGWGEIVLVLQLPHVTVTTLTAPLKARP